MSNVAQTSVEAYYASLEHKEPRNAQLYSALLKRGLHGATLDELVVETGILIQSACGSLKSLRESGVVRRMIERRPTRTGRDAYVHVASKFLPAGDSLFHGQ